MKRFHSILVRCVLPCLAAAALSSMMSLPLAAACHVVTPAGGGSKTGADWNNPYAGLPATLVRGDVYYLADGSYGSYSLNTAASGTTQITIKKAIASDNCTSTGWNVATMGSAQATFTQIAYSGGGYYTINGQVGAFNNNNGLPTEGSFGIYVNGTSCHLGSMSRCVGLDMPSASSTTLSYIEVQGTGATSAANTSTPDDLLYYGGSTNLTIDHVFMHDSSCDFTFGYGSSNLLVQYSYFYKNWGAGSCHGQVSWNGNAHTGTVWRYNTMRTIEGSAIWTAATAGGGTTYDGVEIYGNVIYWGGTADKAGYQCLGDGVFTCLNSGVSCNGLQFYNNTMVNLQASGSAGNNCGAGAAGIYYDPASSGGTATAANNVWYSTSSGAAGPSFSGGTITHSYNSALGTTAGGLSETGAVNDAGAANPFVSWSGSGNLNAELAVSNSDVNNWLVLSSPFATDPLGVARTSSRGAYQYGSAQMVPATAPPNVTTTIH